MLLEAAMEPERTKALKILHYLKKENSGLARCTLELAKYEERAGHQVVIKEPHTDMPMYGVEGAGADVECIHSQLPPEHYFNTAPRIMWQHGEPLSSVGNGVSMKAICDLSSKVDAFICMRRREWPVWNTIKRTYLVPKGIDLEAYKPLEGITEKLQGEPAILYAENWRGTRNPLYACIAMQQVYKRFPKARLYLYNCTDEKMKETFTTFLRTCKLWACGVVGIQGPVNDINLLYNRVDMVVSCLFPLYARSMECFGAGKPLICPGYDEPGYPFLCELDPQSIAEAIIDCWEKIETFDARAWATEHHDVARTVEESVKVYERYAG